MHPVAAVLHDDRYIGALPARKRALFARLATVASLPASDIAGSKWPVVIVGAGPAGAAAAIVLRRHNCPVVLLDQYPPPREKVCGDGLIADAHDALRALGVLASVQAVGYSTRVGRIVSPSRCETTIAADFTTLERHFLDGLLVSEAIDRGATFVLGRVQRAQTQSDGTIALCIDGAAEPVYARHLIIASGATGRSWWRSQPAAASAVAARCYIRTPIATPEMLMVFSKTLPNGYGWMFPLGDDIYNVGVIRFRTADAAPKQLRSMFRAFIEQAPIVREAWSRSTPLSELKGAPLRCGLDLDAANPHPASMAVGECIATTFPFTGEGIGKALQSGIVAAEQAVQAIEARTFAPITAYRQRVASELRASYGGYVVAQKWLRRGWMYDLLVRRIEKSAYLRAIATGIIAGSSDAARLFSLASVAKSFWR